MKQDLKNDGLMLASSLINPVSRMSPSRVFYCQGHCPLGFDTVMVFSELEAQQLGRE